MLTTKKSCFENYTTQDVETLAKQVATLYSEGKFEQAIPIAKEALEMCEKTYGPDHPNTATSLHNLAALYESMGDYAKAELLLQRALRINEKVLGPEHPNTATSLNNLAALYQSMGDYAKAEPLYQRALKIKEKVLGPEHPATATALNGLALLYEGMGDYAKAEPLYQRALKIREKVLGPEHPDTAICLNNLALLYCRMRDYAKAEPLYQRALRINEKVIGPEHPYTASLLANLAFLYFDLNNNSQALVLARKVETARTKIFENILSFASEHERLAFQEQAIPYSLFATLNNAPELALAVLRHKGVVLDSLVEDRLLAEASQNPADRALIDQLRAAQRRHMQLLLEVPKDFSEAALQRCAAEREQGAKGVEELQSKLARHATGLGRARRALSVTTGQVQAAIPSQTALIELVRYVHYLGKNKLEFRYGAIVLAPAGEPKWVSLGSASAIEKNIALCQVAVRIKTSDIKLAGLLRNLYQQLWSPLESSLPLGVKRVIISPDGLLNFVSFATLLTPEDKFLAEKYSISYVASGRDLLREIKPGPTSEMLVYANPDFSGKGSTTAKGFTNNLLALRSTEMRDLQNLHLDSLPGTANESAALESQAKKWNWPIRVFLDADATEAQLQAVRSPHILHLATHGFFLPETDAAGSRAGNGERGVGGITPFSGSGLIAGSGSSLKQQVILKNPMHRSGLALAGAQATLDAWKRGETPPTGNDGIVTAEEVGGLKLDGTWLVTLSAWDTGTGEARSGEGVLGLRRGFIQAGAQNLLMTLWSVADEETGKFMLDFYSAAQKSGNAPEALANVQRDWLVKLRKERGLAAAVNLVGPFIMSSQGPLK